MEIFLTQINLSLSNEYEWYVSYFQTYIQKNSLIKFDLLFYFNSLVISMHIDEQKLNEYFDKIKDSEKLNEEERLLYLGYYL